MQLSFLDGLIIGLYLLCTLVIGIWVSRRSGANMRDYFLGGKRIPWWALGVSNASGMFDIAGTMWLVSMMFVYGVKSAWLPWIWPVFNQIFLMMYLSAWLRRSNAMTGAEWLASRFGEGKGTQLSHAIIVIFALISAIGFIAYAFKGIGKFAEVFLPWDWSPNTYALAIFVLTTAYVVKGGMISVVVTEIIQFVLMTIAAIAVGLIALSLVTPSMIENAVPEGWLSLGFAWELDLDWTGLIDSVNEKIDADGFSLFGLFFMMMLFKGILASMAGPVPGYDMQRILACKDAKDAAKMSGVVSLVMLIPRYMMVVGLAVMALVFMGPEIQASNKSFDFEQVLPYAISHFIPVGLVGLLIAGLLAAFMSTFAATVNAAPAYFVNDIYRRYLKPNENERHYVKLSYVVSLILVMTGVGFGWVLDSINDIMQWVFAALFGGYAAANVLKWHWWRFNGYGYFGGMTSGLVASLALPILFPALHPLYAFPYLLLAGALGSILGSILTPADDIRVLSKFYETVRPWGVWGPIKAHVQAQNPAFVASAPSRDLFNVAIGIVWQTSLVLIAMYLILQAYLPLALSVLTCALTSYILKRTWYDKLEA
ncbi:sodium:solute symporter family protein [Agaribacter marinus]|uniref:Sodium:solute symporter n=1 Tax=Agaribacter marinus TaxID=1431249 RepID=A0AA37WJZ1_9ALTE|nr:sodium:solute symporter family protein [Agaribacter marinus]GLR70400.1 sodium:solute symporter [Agaribacter marinus]